MGFVWNSYLWLVFGLVQRKFLTIAKQCYKEDMLVSMFMGVFGILGVISMIIIILINSIILHEKMYYGFKFW